MSDEELCKELLVPGAPHGKTSCKAIKQGEYGDQCKNYAYKHNDEYWMCRKAPGGAYIKDINKKEFKRNCDVKGEGVAFGLGRRRKKCPSGRQKALKKMEKEYASSEAGVGGKEKRKKVLNQC